MGDKWTFDSFLSGEGVTDGLREKNAAVARVAINPKEEEACGPAFRVWYVESDDGKKRHWHLTRVDSVSKDPDSDDAVTTILNGSDTAAVTYHASEDAYLVWWTPR